MTVYLYGAGIIAYGIYKAVQELWGITVKGFLVTDKSGQPDLIDGIPVYSLKECREDLSESFILIAAPAEYQDSMEQELMRMGLTSYRRLDAHSEYELMGKYLRKVQGISFIEDYQTDRAVIRNEDACVYMAVSHKDKMLKGIYNEELWIQKIQAGAALTDKRILELTDEGKDSLSAENDLYGELTAAYYAWKHNRKRITGLFHYRRVLRITGEQLYLLKTKKIDVILPLPFVCFPDASGQYGRYILPRDIEIMKQVLKECERENYIELENLLKSPYLYNYNILIARKEVFDDYCGWLFPMLRQIADRCEKEKRDRMPRYIGRIGEVMTSLYFMRNKKNWKITHGEKVWRI